MTVDNPNVPVAFALVIGAGFATALGAAVVFFPSLVKLASRKVLASGLGISAGVMIYVSFTELFTNSRQAFVNANESDSYAYMYATLSFFGGVVVMIILDLVVHLLVGKGHGHDHHVHHDEPDNHEHHCHSSDDRHDHVVDLPDDHDHPRGSPHDHVPDEHVHHHHHDPSSQEEKESCDDVPQVCFTCSPDPVADLERLQQQADLIIARNLAAEQVHNEVDTSDAAELTHAAAANADNDAENGGKRVDSKAAEEQKKLIKMGISTAVAIGLHNFPEGLATFVAALNNPKVGLVLAIAIGIHNIPEGLCVALPVYYATGNRTKAFLWAVLSGASEPFAALLGWAVLANSVSQQMYGILFGLVSGMMVIISVRELLPTAHRYDPDDTLVTYSFIGGAGVMALSLVLFTL